MTREESIRRIENHIRIHSKQEQFRAVYITEALEMAIEALKAQEPRVMTLEEAQGADYCWYESRTANICILCDATMYPNLNGKPKTELQTMGTAVRGWQYDYAYGKDWRCWDKEPTNGQREAEPWNL